jgi:hypothetical protein
VDLRFSVLVFILPDPLTVRDLRRRWKPHKERLGENPTNIRFHRACSWLQRVEDNPDDLDDALLSQWTAINALHGQWDDLQKEPVADQAC